MSNPGVLYLSNVRLGNGVNFRVEDNIGEAIHFHYGDEWRIDLTVEEYFSLISKIDVCIEDLLKGTGFEMKLFDPIFLDMISSFLLDLESVYIENIKLSSLIVETKNVIGLPVMRSLSQSRIVKALKGQTRELEEYKQENYKGQTNIERVERMKTNISLNGYPFDGKYIVVFNNQNVIKDGQHRAACLLYEKGDMVVPVVRMQFKNNKYNVSMHPWFNKLFIWNVHRIKRGVKKILLFQKHFMIRMKRKILKR
jgi:hypothetical protein